MSADGQTQTVESGATLDVPCLDFSSFSDTAGRAQAFDEAVEKEISEPFDLASGPLLRVRVVKLSDVHHVVLWTAHHVICDGLSAGVIMSELAKIYSASGQGISRSCARSPRSRSSVCAGEAGRQPGTCGSFRLLARTIFQRTATAGSSNGSAPTARQNGPRRHVEENPRRLCPAVAQAGCW